MNPIFVVDGTISINAGPARADICKFFDKHCKKWSFQQETGETGYEHYQCRISMKKRMPFKKICILLKSLKGSWSPTCKQNMGNDFYVTKDDTRTDGPWRDAARSTFIPKDRRHLEPLPWHRQVMAMEPVDRIINVIVDTVGNMGKSGLYWQCRAKEHYVIEVDVTCPWDRITADMCSELSKAKMREPFLAIADFPKSVATKQMTGVLRALELLDSQRLKDSRHSSTVWRFNRPRIWVFSKNPLPANCFTVGKIQPWKLEIDGDRMSKLVRC